MNVKARAGRKRKVMKESSVVLLYCPANQSLHIYIYMYVRMYIYSRQNRNPIYNIIQILLTQKILLNLSRAIEHFHQSINLHTYLPNLCPA